MLPQALEALLVPAAGELSWWGDMPPSALLDIDVLATKGMGPSYMSHCLGRHLPDTLNGAPPDIAVLECESSAPAIDLSPVTQPVVAHGASLH